MLVRLLESRQLAADLRHFVFELLGDGMLVFKPGQFVSLSAQIAGKTITRAYSIASAPDTRQFELCLNRVDEGHFSPYLFDLAPGAEVMMQGPAGFFTLREPISDSVMVATGTGIAPFRSMLGWLLPQNSTCHITLLFGVRYEPRLLYRDEFEQLARRHANFRFWPTLSRQDAGWEGRAGHVQQHLMEAIGERRDLDVYVCGLKAMVDDVRARLKAAGFDRKRIIYEKYD